MLGNAKQNKWCCFCQYWFDPAHEALTPRPGRDLFDLNMKVCKKCQKHSYTTKACSTCAQFERKAEFC